MALHLRYVGMFRGSVRARALVSPFSSSSNQSTSIFSAITSVKENAKAKFDETVELNVRLGLDPRKQDQHLRASVVLPHGTGKEKKVCVFTASKEEAESAIAAGAALAGGEDLVARIQESGADGFDYCIAASDALGHAKKLGRVLGPKGLMPNAKDGTVVAPSSVADAIAAAKRGRIAYRTCKQGSVSIPVGKVSFTEEALADNVKAAVSSFFENKPPGAKGKYLRKAFLSSTMGSGHEVNTAFLTPTSQWFFRRET